MRQREYYIALSANLIFLLLASLISCTGAKHWGTSMVQAFCLLATLCTSIYIASTRPVRSWYAARALAESVKTMAWRYSCRAEPFCTSDESDRALFLARVTTLARQNSQISNLRSPATAMSQVSKSMSDLRGLPASRRASVYLGSRVEEQLGWYISKAASNEKSARILFSIILIANIAAVASALLRIRFYSYDAWPTEIFVTLSAITLTWYQARKSGEQAASYSLAAHEISAIKDAFPISPSDQELSELVSSAENAFSREHTQWIARQDH